MATIPRVETPVTAAIVVPTITADLIEGNGISHSFRVPAGYKITSITACKTSVTDYTGTGALTLGVALGIGGAGATLLAGAFDIKSLTGLVEQSVPLTATIANLSFVAAGYVRLRLDGTAITGIAPAAATDGLVFTIYLEAL